MNDDHTEEPGGSTEEGDPTAETPEEASPETPEVAPAQTAEEGEASPETGVSTGKKVAFIVLGIFVSLILLLVVAEVAVRILKPDPRVQMIRNLGGIEITLIDGVPVWREMDDNSIVNKDCIANHRANGVEPLKVLLFGSSIFYGSGVEMEDNFSLLLQNRLDKERLAAGEGGEAMAPVCVINLSQPAFGHGNKYALATQEVPAYKPDLIFWEVWKNELNKHVMVGDTVYSVDELHVGEDGVPTLLGIPPGPNRWLIENSRFYEYAVLALSRNEHQRDWDVTWREYAEEDLSHVIDLVETHGAKLELVFCPPLDKPFAETLKNWDLGYAEVKKYAEGRGITTHRLSEALVEEDYMAIRDDPCCHYNAEGHRKILDHVYDWTLAALK